MFEPRFGCPWLSAHVRERHLPGRMNNGEYGRSRGQSLGVEGPQVQILSTRRGENRSAERIRNDHRLVTGVAAVWRGRALEPAPARRRWRPSATNIGYRSGTSLAASSLSALATSRCRSRWTWRSWAVQRRGVTDPRRSATVRGMSLPSALRRCHILPRLL